MVRIPRGHSTEDFKWLSGTYVDFYMPVNSLGVNFVEILIEYQAVQTCDAGYEILMGFGWGWRVGLGALLSMD